MTVRMALKNIYTHEWNCFVYSVSESIILYNTSRYITIKPKFHDFLEKFDS